MTDNEPLLLQTAVDCYLSAIFLFAECLESACPEIASPHRDQLMRLRRRLAFDTTVETLTESREALCNELASFGIRARECREGESPDLSPIRALLEHADSSFALSKDGYEDQFRHFSRELKALDALQNAKPVSEKLRAQLSRMEEFVGAVYEQNSKVFSRMHHQLEHAQARLEVAETLAVGELDRQLNARIETGRPFCMILLNFGKDQKDEVLKQAAARLMEQIRSSDFACSLGSDKFVVLLESALVSAEVRGRQIASWLGGAYRAGTVTVNVDVSVAAAGHIRGETPDQLLARVERLLYEAKPDTTGQLAQLAERLIETSLEQPSLTT